MKIFSNFLLSIRRRVEQLKKIPSTSIFMVKSKWNPTSRPLPEILLLITKKLKFFYVSRLEEIKFLNKDFLIFNEKYPVKIKYIGRNISFLKKEISLISNKLQFDFGSK